ncbi:hypothetical protein [Brevibacillus massiliensis]|uniref:hypothetical protein n=1 Tax=Brevibacillus massiliensis TaxID=1118054 RepID=UPI00030225E1|nr:hypothetical protein [Brevibacillus massiliensis]
MDWIKLLTVGIPAAFVISYVCLNFSPISQFFPFGYHLVVIGGSGFQMFGGIVLGYVLHDSLQKQEASFASYGGFVNRL